MPRISVLYHSADFRTFNFTDGGTTFSRIPLALIADRPQSTFFGQNAAFLIQTNFTKLEQTFVNMTSKTLKKKVIEYINHAEDNVIEAVYKMLKIYEDSDGKSLMTTEQKSEIERRSALFRQGKLKTSSWSDVKKRTRTT
jgi:2-iminoacetate synthase ThiH